MTLPRALAAAGSVIGLDVALHKTAYLRCETVEQTSTINTVSCWKAGAAL
jgi:hypothetical protein